MTQEEFAKGWVMLLLQPWGKRYQDGPNADLQRQLYYEQLAHLSAFQWSRIATTFAGGDHWPTLDEIRNYVRVTWTLPGPSSEQAMGMWHVRLCENCQRAMIRERVGSMGHAFCKWCQEQPEVVPGHDKLRIDTGPFMSKEEFGLDLFECIKAFAEREQVRILDKKMRERPDVSEVHRRRMLDQYEAKDAALTALILRLLPTIAAEDARRLLTRYEQ